MAPIKTLIVDDAPFMRKTMQRILSHGDLIEVAGTASNGQECLRKVAEQRPDVITLDIDMPVMNGISAVKNIMVRYQIPIVIISSLVHDGFFAFEAFRLGVMDFIPKPSKIGEMKGVDEEELIRKRVLTAAGMEVQRMRRVRCKHQSIPFKSSPANQPKRHGCDGDHSCRTEYDYASCHRAAPQLWERYNRPPGDSSSNSRSVLLIF